MFFWDDFLQLDKEKKDGEILKKGVFLCEKLGPIHHIMRGENLKSPNLKK
jgi:hypothetical protein